MAYQLFGIGSCAAGVGDGVGCGITEEARLDVRLAFFFHGVGLETAKMMGDFGFVRGVASGLRLIVLTTISAHRETL